jgi:exosortase
MKRNQLLAILLLGLTAVAFSRLATWDPRSQAYDALVGWFFSTSDSSPQLIFGIVAGLLFLRRRELMAALGRAQAPFWAAVCLVPAAVIHVWAQWVDAADLLVVSLGLGALGSGLLLGGRPLGRLIAAPLAILVFALPFPGPLHNLVVYPYQLHTAAFVNAVLGAVGYTVTLNGDLLTLGQREFEVIETCSGLRSALTLGLLAGAWVSYFRCTVRHGAWLLVSSLPIAFVTNGIRVIVLVLDPRPEVQESHVAQGLVMFVVGTGLLSLVDRLLLRIFRDGSPPAAEEPGPAAAVSSRPLLVLGGVLVLAASASLALPSLRPTGRPNLDRVSLPAKLHRWQVEQAPTLGHFLGNVYFTHRSHRIYERRLPRRRVTAFLGLDDHRLRTHSLVSEKNALPGHGWEEVERDVRWLQPGPVRMQWVLADRFGVQELVLFAYAGTRSVGGEIFRALLALDQPGSPWRREEPARLLRLSTPVPPGPSGVEEAEAVLRAFYARMPPRVRVGAPE